jgi:hypothetical protein
MHLWRQATHSKYTNLITPASGAAHLSEQSRQPASNQPAADRAAIYPPFPAKSLSAKHPTKKVFNSILERMNNSNKKLVSI